MRRVLIEKAQVSAQQHRVTYDSPIEPESVIKEISDLKQQFTQYGGARPYGAALMIGGVVDGKPSLFTSDVTGNYFSYFANAIGENDDRIKDKIKRKLQERFDNKERSKIGFGYFQRNSGRQIQL